MCADSQETSGDYKWPVEKMVVDSRYGFPLIIAGAGFGAAIDNAIERIVSRLRGGYGTHEKVLEQIQDILRDIHANDLAHHPSNDLRELQFELLIAFRVEDDWPQLYQTSGSMLHRVKHFAVIGSGAVVNYFAHALYRKSVFNQSAMTLSAGKTLAIYLAHLAKNQLSSVGGSSSLAAMDAEGEITIPKQWEIPQWEIFFRNYQKLQGDLMLACANPECSEEFVHQLVDKFSAEIKRHKHELTEEIIFWEELLRPTEGSDQQSDS
jgi:hypothetical protein